MATNSAGAVYVDLEFNNKNYNKQINSNLKNTESAFGSSMKKIGTLIVSAFAVKEVVGFTKTCVDSASKVQSAFTGLNSIVQGTGNSFSQAQKFVQEYTKDGLVSIEETATAYKNLLARGYDTSQIENVMTRLKDSAAFGRQASYDLGEAVVSATEGLKNENSILVDNAGVTKNVAKMWEDWAKAHGTTTSAMTQAQKIEAEYNGIMEETKFQVGDAASYTKTFGGLMQQLKFKFDQMKVAIGKVVTPLVQLFIPVINTAISAITNFFTKLQDLLKSFGLEVPDVVSKGTASIEGIGTSATEAEKEATSAAKKINKAFAPLDEINTLGNNKSSDSSSGGGGTSVETPSIDVNEGPIKETDNAFSKLIDKVKELQELFNKGFDSTFNIDFKSINKSIKNIGKSLKNIFNDSDVKNAGENFAKSFTYNLGRVVGSIGTIGGNIAEGLVGGIELYLKNNSGRIKQFIVKMFSIGEERATIIGDFSETLAQISNVFKGPAAKQISSDIIGMIANPLMSLTTTFNQFTNDMLELFFNPIENNSSKVETAINKTLNPISNLTETIDKAFTETGENIEEFYNEYISPYLEKIGTGFDDTFGKFLDMYNEKFAPFFDKCSKKLSELWDDYLAPLQESLGGLFGELTLWMTEFYERRLKPLMDFIVKYVAPIAIPLLEKGFNGVLNIVKWLSTGINNFIGVLTNVLKFVRGVFTGDWETAWEGIKGIFNTYMGSIHKLFRGPLNAIIKAMNKFIDGVNNIKLPDWKVLGDYAGKSFNFKKFKEIPDDPIQLAEGGWVAPNNPQLAIVGDNTREGEIIAPESKIYNQVSKAIQDNNGVGKQELEITFKVEYEDGRTIIKKINQEQIKAGEILLTI